MENYKIFIMNIKISSQNLLLFWCALITVMSASNPKDSEDYVAAALRNSDVSAEARKVLCSAGACPKSFDRQQEYIESSILENAKKTNLILFTTHSFYHSSPRDGLGGARYYSPMIGVLNFFFKADGLASIVFYLVLVLLIISSTLILKDNFMPSKQ